MVRVVTDLGDLHDLARNLRVEDVGSITSNNIQGALDAIASSSRANWQQRSIISSGDLPITSQDVVLNVAPSSALSITIPAASTRNGTPLILEDPTGTWAAHNPTFNCTGADTFDGATSLVGKINYGWIMLRPYNDGVNAGYKVQGVWQ